MALDIKQCYARVRTTSEEGDFAECHRGTFSHRGVYVGKGDIVHLDTTGIIRAALGISSSSAFTKCGTGHRKACVKTETFMKVAGESKAKKNNDKDKTTPPLPGEEIKERALSSVESSSYSLLGENMEMLYQIRLILL